MLVCVSWLPGLLRRIRGFYLREISFSEFICSNDYPFFCLPCYFLIVTRCTAHCHFNRVQVQALPTEQAAPVLTDSFSRGYDPYTHACKARPLTTVGRTSLRCHHLVHRVGSNRSHILWCSALRARTARTAGRRLHDSALRRTQQT